MVQPLPKLFKHQKYETSTELSKLILVYVLVFLGDRWNVEGLGAMDMRKELKGLTWGVG